MKKKTVAIAFLSAVLGGFVAVATYFHFFSPDKQILNEILTSRLVQGNNGVAKYVSLGESSLPDFTEAAEKTVHAVVHIKTKFTEEYMSNPIYDFFFGVQPRRYEQTVPLSAGSGVIVSPNGYIVTNYHVIRNADIIEVTLNDKRKFKAKVVGVDKMTDLALLKIDADNLPFLEYGDSDKLKVGELVLAVGNPFNLTSTVTAGIVSAKARSLSLLSRYGIEAYIQTDAAVNPGNSGGALVNTKGELVGINAAIASNTGSYTGYSFAIPVNIVKKVVADLIKYGKIQRAFIGASIVDLNADIAKYLGVNKTEGVYIYEVNPRGAAAEAGIKAGDIITKINNTSIKSLPELQEQLAKYRPGDIVDITVLRDGKSHKYEVKLKNVYGTDSIVRY
jgi:serine protease Do